MKQVIHWSTETHSCPYTLETLLYSTQSSNITLMFFSEKQHAFPELVMQNFKYNDENKWHWFPAS